MNAIVIKGVVHELVDDIEESGCKKCSLSKGYDNVADCSLLCTMMRVLGDQCDHDYCYFQIKE